MFWCLISLGRRGQLTLLTCMYSLKIEMLLFSKFLLGFSNFQKQLAKLFNFCHSKMENGVPRNASVRSVDCNNHTGIQDTTKTIFKEKIPRILC
ncbi:hypothetical protein GLYMA_08G240900v4 [Glycine max]|uniref:Uncharacterized protein n=1 Tax=Glycine max TaxID=3847 RepID=A0A0R0IRR8_SOYBN|nr:hypothetical protein JHK85_022760 [Glycine max]KAH1052842.1 hypothetical protein GYH30_022231 [Glycine max]KRH44950.1 hypothetical protein GLYMA_08G240900v4 [Glycine max]